MPKEHLCPECRSVLVSGKGLKLKCPKRGCTFVDRRNGNSTLDPNMDRRGAGVPLKNDPWKFADRKSFR